MEPRPLEELLAEQRQLEGQITELRERLKALLPEIDAAWKLHNEAEAAKADPALTQKVG